MEEKKQAGDGFGRHIVQYPAEYSLCAGCSTCEIACTLTHDGLVSPSYKRIFLKQAETTSMIHTILSCQHCSDHPCYEKCPQKDKAMCIDEKGIVYIVEENCIGCGLCVKACKYEIPRINMVKDADRKKRKAKKCDLCREREEGPACVQWCPWKCLGMSDDPAPTSDAVAQEK